jgi:serine/threonine protein phosphatase PrpC
LHLNCESFVPCSLLRVPFRRFCYPNLNVKQLILWWGVSAFIAQESVELAPGDGVVLYTDGITEARDIDRQFYRLARLCEVVSSNWHKTSAQIEQAVIDDLRGFIGEQKVFDDITLVVLKRRES